MMPGQPPEVKQPVSVPQGAPEAPPEEGADQAQGGVQVLIVGIHNNLLKFKELIGSVPQVPDQVKAQLDSVISGYKGVVDSIAGGAQGEQPPAPDAAPAPSGPAPVSKGPMPMSSGRGAVPAM